MTQETNPRDPRGETESRIKTLGLQEQVSDWIPWVFDQAKEDPSDLMFLTVNTTQCKIVLPIYQIKDAVTASVVSQMLPQLESLTFSQRKTSPFLLGNRW